MRDGGGGAVGQRRRVQKEEMSLLRSERASGGWLKECLSISEAHSSLPTSAAAAADDDGGGDDDDDDGDERIKLLY